MPPPLDPLSVDVLSDPGRLGALATSGLPDSEPEEAFDRLTRLVQRCLRVPVALVSVVDDQRQFFKSHQGLPEPWCSIRETPLSHSFCQHVVRLDGPLVIEDAREDDLVRDNLAIPDLNVVAYLGVPLRTPGGFVLGSLCAIDSVPRTWTAADTEVMEALAEAVMAEIDVRYRIREAGDEALDRSVAAFRALFEGLPQATAVLAADGMVIEANPAALALVGLPREAVVGQRLASVLPVDDAAEGRLREAIATASGGGAVWYDEAVEDERGRPRALRLGVYAVPDGDGLLLFEARAPGAVGPAGD